MSSSPLEEYMSDLLDHFIYTYDPYFSATEQMMFHIRENANLYTLNNYNCINNMKAIVPMWMEEIPYRNEKTQEERERDVRQIKTTHSYHTVVYIHCEDEILSKHKYIVHSDMSFGQFAELIRSRVKLSRAEAVYYLTSKNTSVTFSRLLSEIENEFSSEDGIVYFNLRKEAAFG